jgi:alpha-1,2-mannosyltransferase
MLESTTVTRRTLIQVPIVLALAGGAWAFLAAFAVRHGSFDLQVYYGAVHYWLRDHGDVYDYLRPFTKYGFTYPPFAGLTMAPMAVLPWWAVNALSIVGSVLSTFVVLDWFLRPVVRRYGWTRWFTVAMATCVVAIFEPLHETVSFGQVNLLLLVLVLADFRYLVAKDSRWGGVAVGLATAVKLTPGIFILYLLLTRRFRAALTATGTAAGATVLAMLVAPDASREFWTDALWDTDRVGTLSFISNQSLEGFVARLHPAHPSTVLWAVLVVLTLGFWAWRVRRVDDLTGVALTGVVACLVSPVTWIHHLVWLLPAFLLLVERGLLARGRTRIRWLALWLVLYGLLCSRLPWAYAGPQVGVGFWFSNTYVLVAVVLLAVLPARSTRSRSAPTRSAQRTGVPELGKVDDGAVGPADGVGAPGAVGDEAGPLVEATGPGVLREHP